MGQPNDPPPQMPAWMGKVTHNPVEQLIDGRGEPPQHAATK